MSAEIQSQSDLLVSSNFVRAIRESGYVNLATALAELVDNSLQANATKVEITVTRNDSEFPEITVEDNGMGMNMAELSSCPCVLGVQLNSMVGCLDWSIWHGTARCFTKSDSPCGSCFLATTLPRAHCFIGRGRHRLRKSAETSP